MNELDQDTMSDAFHACWSAAGNHLNRQVEGGIKFWLRARRRCRRTGARPG
jgi:hypothetical protein